MALYLNTNKSSDNYKYYDIYDYDKLAGIIEYNWVKFIKKDKLVYVVGEVALTSLTIKKQDHTTYPFVAVFVLHLEPYEQYEWKTKETKTRSLDNIERFVSNFINNGGELPEYKGIFDLGYASSYKVEMVLAEPYDKKDYMTIYDNLFVIRSQKVDIPVDCDAIIKDLSDKNEQFGNKGNYQKSSYSEKQKLDDRVAFICSQLNLLPANVKAKFGLTNDEFKSLYDIISCEDSPKEYLIANGVFDLCLKLIK